MNWQSAYNQGLTITGNPALIPGLNTDDQGKWVSVARAAKETGIDRTTIIGRVKSKNLEGIKINGCWQIRLSSYRKLVETYRYGRLKTMAGSWWTDKEKAVLASDLSHAEAANKLNRSYDAVRIMRCRMKKGGSMNPSTKIFATLSLAAATGAKIHNLESSEQGKVLGKALCEAGHIATGRYPYSALKRQKISQILSAVESLLNGPVTPQSVLSMLIAGLIDIRAKCNSDKWQLLDPVIECAGACLDMYPDSNTDNERAFEQYQRWAA